MRRAKIVLLRLDYLLGTAIIICQILYIRQMVSILFYLSFLVSIALWICTTTESLDGLDRLTIAIIMLALIHVAINAAITDAVFSFEYLKKYIMFCCSMVFLSAIRRISLDRGTFRFLEVLFLIVGIFMLFMFFFRNQQMHLLNGRYTRYLTFRFNNPNLTALFLACMTMFLEVAAFQERRIPMKILLYAVAAAELVFLFLTKSRNALLAVGLFTIVAIWFLLRRRRIAFRKGVLGLVAVFPILFAIAYLFFIDNADSVKLFSFFAGEGKLLNSRSKVWKAAFQAFESSPIFGAYYQISGGTGLSQMHNTHVDILTSYGLSVLVLVCVYLYLLMRDSQMKVKPSASSTPLLGFICALFLGVGEAALFSGGLSVYLFFGIFLAMTDKGEETDEERRTEAPRARSFSQ